MCMPTETVLAQRSEWRGFLFSVCRDGRVKLNWRAEEAGSGLGRQEGSASCLAADEGGFRRGPISALFLCEEKSHSIYAGVNKQSIYQSRYIGAESLPIIAVERCSDSCS